MSLVTRCPQCATAFRVQSAQLAAKGGKVRCGKCTAVFDGVAHLVTPPSESQAASSREPSPQLGLFEPGRAPARTAPATVVAPAMRRSPPLEVETEVEFLAEPEPEKRFSVMWALLAFLAFTALLTQVAYRYRTEIGVLAPEARPYLAAACEMAGCELRLPRRPELMSIESSELQADGLREAVIVLNAVLRNRAPFLQEYPALELTLTDPTDQAVVRRVLYPVDYLGERRASQVVPQGVPPGAEVIVRVPLDTRLVTATGYRLYLFFP
jgi:predicted Zn finger-like uncharacterized protein